MVNIYFGLNLAIIEYFLIKMVPFDSVQLIALNELYATCNGKFLGKRIF